MGCVVYVSGASSGIGEALTQHVPYADARVIGISRRSCRFAEHLQADLSLPAAWVAVAAEFKRDLGKAGVERAVFLHMAGVGFPYGLAVPAALDVYASAVVLNSGAGQVLGKAFLSACALAAVPATVVLCTSPATLAPLRGMSHYGSGKSAMEYWIRCMAEETGPEARVLGVMPFATDTAMARDAIEEAPEHVPAPLLEAARRGEMATPGDVAREIWTIVTGNAASGSIVPVGAVPSGQ
jgi:NAD(P)-dependent dehydrogenase (short-subunit alcohol dehydrogenase family)